MAIKAKGIEGQRQMVGILTAIGPWMIAPVCFILLLPAGPRLTQLPVFVSSQ
ncbi:MAG TPA: hypothetical protein VF717_02105 [Pyrinomonadaceae bacterium]